MGKTLFYTEEKSESFILAGITHKDTAPEGVNRNLEELGQLTVSAGGRVLDKQEIRVRRISPAYFISRRKAQELSLIIQSHDADGVIFNVNLSPAQQRNLETVIPGKIIDRATLILDIFARRARSKEGKIQVELAQLKYLLPRLKGRGQELSRLGGGIGTRGPGETKLEVDRRKINERIGHLQDMLQQVRQQRSVQRKKRMISGIPIVAIVGYTNAGKSTLLNSLTGAGVLVEDKLFATLDPTVKKLTLPGGTDIALIDTVGFIEDLPPTLVAAFRATLEEITYAHLILQIVDASVPDNALHIKTTEHILTSLNANERPKLLVWNKIDMVEDPVYLNMLQWRHKYSVLISALKGTGIDHLLQALEELVTAYFPIVSLKIPYSDFKIVNKLREHGRVIALNYNQDFVEITAQLPEPQLEQVKNYLTNANVLH